MKFSLKKLKLKYQLAILIGISIFIVIMVQVFYYYSFRVLTQNRAKVYSSTLLNQIEEKLNSIAMDIQETANTVSYNKNTQEYLISKDIKVKFNLYSNISDMLAYTRFSNKNGLSITLVDNEGSNLHTGINNYEDRLGNDYEIRLLQTLETEYGYNNQKFNKAVFTNLLPGIQPR